MDSIKSIKERGATSAVSAPRPQLKAAPPREEKVQGDRVTLSGGADEDRIPSFKDYQRAFQGGKKGEEPRPLPQLPGQRDGDRPREEGDPLENFADNVNDAGRTLADNFVDIAGGDGRITEADLERVADDFGGDRELRDAASLLLRSDAVRNMFDTGAGRGEVDGTISAEDLARRPILRASTNPEEDLPEEIVDDFSILFDTAGGNGGRDGNISTDDLLALATDGGIPQELRDAADQASRFRG